MTNDKKIIFSKDALMPLGMVVTLCAAVVWISSQLNQINYKLESLEQKLEDQWTSRDMENWGLKLKMNNPELELPLIKPNN